MSQPTVDGDMDMLSIYEIDEDEDFFTKSNIIHHFEPFFDNPIRITFHSCLYSKREIFLLNGLIDLPPPQVTI